MVGIGILGLGTVGSSVAKIVEQRAQELASAAGAPMRIAAAGVRRSGAQRPIDESLVTTQLEDVIHHPDVDIVVEVMGGIEPAGSLIEVALSLGKPVVTANKMLLAERWDRLWEVQQAAGAPLEIEASVAGGIPIIRLLRGQLAGNQIRSIQGILNGTCNYILTKMRVDGLPFEEALAESQRLGYAEADPSSDVDGWDTAYKLIILRRLAGLWSPEPQQVSGLRSPSGPPLDEWVQRAAARGGRLRLVAACGQPDLAEVRLVESDPLHPFHAVDGAANSILLNCDALGPLTLTGAGAGGGPTASSVVGDLVHAVRWLVQR